MKIFAGCLIVSFSVYSAVIYWLPNTEAAMLPKAVAGKMVWQQKNCVACHQIYGLGGFLGPDLTNVYSGKGSDYIKAFVQAGTITMPAFNLTDEELENLTSFLQQVDASGYSDPRKHKINFDGTIERK